MENQPDTTPILDESQRSEEDTAAPLPEKLDMRLKPCRMYKDRLPSVDDLVMVRVTKIDSDVYAKVELLEYNCIEGIIMFSELSKVRIRSLKNHIQIGKQEVLQVLRVDGQKGYIDLTKKLLKHDEIEQYTKIYNKSKTVHSIVGHVVALQRERGNKMEMKDLYKSFVWPLSQHEHEHEHVYDAFEAAAKKGEDIFRSVTLSEELREDIMKTILHRMSLHPVKVQADVNVTCFSYEGVDGIIPSLRAAQRLSTDEMPIEIHLQSSPQYSLTTSSIDCAKATELLNSAIEVLKVEIAKYGGECVVKTQARVVG